MSGHSKWATIKHKKARIDAKKGKIFSRLSKEIILAAKLGGGDPNANARLRSAINAAKAANYPNENIDRSIKKGTGELGGMVLEELVYEGYAPGGVAVMVECLTDNRNRTAADIRHMFSKGGGNLGSSGAVSFLFNRKARFVIEGENANEEKLMELFFSANVDVEDITVEDGEAVVLAAPDAMDSVIKCLEGAGITATESGIVRIPSTETPVTDPKIAGQVMRLIETIEEYDDVQNVFNNADISDDVAEKAEA